MARILFRHADVLALNAEHGVYLDAEVAVDGETIVSVGEAPLGFAPDEIVDATDHILMPGFLNAHTHSAMTLLRGWAEDVPLDRWLNERIWPAEANLEAADVYWGAALAAAEMIRGGTIGFADHYFYMDQVARVVVESGLRANLAWCAFGLEGGEIGTDLPGIADFVTRWQGAADGRINTMLGPHSPHMCTPQFLARTAAVAVRLGTGIHVHIAESEAQVKQSLEQYDLTPVEILDRNGILDVPAVVVHAVYLTEPDRMILAAKSATVVQCPTSEIKLGMGVTPVPALVEAGVTVALGTDNAASSNTMSMFREARLAALIQKLQQADPGALAGDLPLRMATQTAAHALGFPLVGEITPGHAADLILIDCATPRLAPRHDLVATVLYSAQDGDVSDVMVAGRWLMRRRKLLTLDEKRILHEARQRASRLVKGGGRPLVTYIA